MDRYKQGAKYINMIFWVEISQIFINLIINVLSIYVYISVLAEEPDKLQSAILLIVVIISLAVYCLNVFAGYKLSKLFEGSDYISAAVFFGLYIVLSLAVQFAGSMLLYAGTVACMLAGRYYILKSSGNMAGKLGDEKLMKDLLGLRKFIIIFTLAVVITDLFVSLDAINTLLSVCLTVAYIYMLVLIRRFRKALLDYAPEPVGSLEENESHIEDGENE